MTWPTTRAELEALGYVFDITQRTRRRQLYYLVTITHEGQLIDNPYAVDITERDAVAQAVQQARGHYSRNR